MRSTGIFLHSLPSISTISFTGIDEFCSLHWCGEPNAATTFRFEFSSSNDGEEWRRFYGNRTPCVTSTDGCWRWCGGVIIIIHKPIVFIVSVVHGAFNQFSNRLCLASTCIFHEHGLGGCFEFKIFYTFRPHPQTSTKLLLRTEITANKTNKQKWKLFQFWRSYLRPGIIGYSLNGNCARHTLVKVVV